MAYFNYLLPIINLILVGFLAYCCKTGVYYMKKCHELLKEKRELINIVDVSVASLKKIQAVLCESCSKKSVEPSDIDKIRKKS